MKTISSNVIVVDSINNYLALHNSAIIKRSNSKTTCTSNITSSIKAILNGIDSTIAIKNRYTILNSYLSSLDYLTYSMTLGDYNKEGQKLSLLNLGTNQIFLLTKQGKIKRLTVDYIYPYLKELHIKLQNNNQMDLFSAPISAKDLIDNTVTEIHKELNVNFSLYNDSKLSDNLMDCFELSTVNLSKVLIISDNAIYDTLGKCTTEDMEWSKLAKKVFTLNNCDLLNNNFSKYIDIPFLNTNEYFATLINL